MCSEYMRAACQFMGPSNGMWRGVPGVENKHSNIAIIATNRDVMKYTFTDDFVF
jgi:hypothetical protein